jgi:hypothetical protein
MCTRPRQQLSDALLPCSLALSSVGHCWTCPSAREGRIAYGNKRPGQSLVQISRRGSTDVHGLGDPPSVPFVRGIAGMPRATQARQRQRTRAQGRDTACTAWRPRLLQEIYGSWAPCICAAICRAVVGALQMVAALLRDGGAEVLR